MSIDFSSIHFANENIVVGGQSYSFTKMGFFEGKRAYLTTEGTVKTLNVVQRFFRFFFGAYKKTRAKKVWKVLTDNGIGEKNCSFPGKKDFRQSVQRVIQDWQQRPSTPPTHPYPNPTSPHSAPTNPTHPNLPLPNPDTPKPNPGPSGPSSPQKITGVSEENKKDIPFEEFQTGFRKFLKAAGIQNMQEEEVRKIYNVIQQKKSDWFAEVQEREEGNVIQKGKKYILGEIEESKPNSISFRPPKIVSYGKVQAMVAADGEIELLIGGEGKPSIGDGAYRKYQEGFSYQRGIEVGYGSYKIYSDQQKIQIAHELDICPYIYSSTTPKGLFPETYHVLQYEGFAKTSKESEKSLCQKTSWVQKKYQGSLEIFLKNLENPSRQINDPQAKNLRPLDWSLQDKLRALKTSCGALGYLGGQSIANNDVKIHNILLDEERNGVVGDFDAWSRNEPGREPSTIPFLPPEALEWDSTNWQPQWKDSSDGIPQTKSPDSNNSFGEYIQFPIKHDVYAFGCSLEWVFMEILLPFIKQGSYQMYDLTGFIYPQKNGQETEARKKKRTEIEKNDFNKKLYEIVCKVKAHKPEDRPTAVEVVSMLEELEKLIPEEEKGSKKVEPPKKASPFTSSTFSFKPASQLPNP